MNSPRVLLLAVVGVLLLALVIVPLQASAGDAPAKGKERSVTLDQVPAAVKATILKEAGTHKVREIEEITFPDKVFYEAEWKVDGKEIEITIAPDGTLLDSDTEDEDEDDDGEDDDGEDDD